MDPTRAPEFAELLAHGDFVRALARSLLFEPADAEDLAQQAWLNALRSPPRSAQNLRGWLATVLRNAARKRHRSALARQRHEHAVVRPEATVSAAEIAAREEIRRRVVEAVQALDEPYRGAVLLRFYEDLPPREIATRQAVPVETVKTRIKRGLAQLRSRLDGVHGGRRTAWAFALLAVAGSPPDAQAAGVGAGVGAAMGGGLAMAAKVKLGIAALVLASVGTAIWQVSGLGDAPPASTGAGPGAAVTEPASRPTVPDTRLPTSGVGAPAHAPSDSTGLSGQPPAAPVPTAPDRAAHGKVLARAGEPVAGATVACLVPVRSDTDLDWRPDRAVTTDRDGAFRVPIPREVARWACLRVTADGFARSDTMVELPAAGDPDSVEIRLGSGASLDGFLTGPGGAGLAGGVVAVVIDEHRQSAFLESPSHDVLRQARGDRLGYAVTDAQGRYEIAGAPAEATLSLRAAHPGHAGTYSEPLRLEPGERRRVDLTVSAAATVHGTLRRPDGSPSDGAIVSFARDWHVPGDRFPSFYCITDGAGRYRHDGLPPGFEYRVSSGDAYRLAMLPKLAAGEQREIDLTLPEPEPPTGPLVRVRVVDTAGEALGPERIHAVAGYGAAAAARVRVRPTALRGDGRVPAMWEGDLLDADGTVTIGVEGAGPFDVTLAILGHEILVRDVRPGGEPTRIVVDWDAVAGSLGRLHVTVREAGTERPIEGASISLGPGGPLADVLRVELRTDVSGKAASEPLARGDHRVVVAAPGFALWEQTVRLAAGATQALSVSLERQAVVRGQILPPPGVRLNYPFVRVLPLRPDGSALPWVTPREGQWRYETPIADREGGFELGQLPPGPMVLHISAGDCAPVNLALTLAAGETRTVAIQLDRGRYVRFRVPEEDHDRDTITARTPTGDPVLTRFDWSLLGGGARDEFYGCFAPGRYEIEVRRDGRVRLRGSIEVTTDDATDLRQARPVELHE